MGRKYALYYISVAFGYKVLVVVGEQNKKQNLKEKNDYALIWNSEIQFLFYSLQL